MKANIAKFLKISIPLGLGLFIIWYTYNKFTPEQLSEIKTYFAQANYGFVILSVMLSVISHLSRAYRWTYMLTPLGYTPKLANNFMAVSIAYLMNIFIPKSGEVSRAVIMDKYESIPFEKGFGTIISERIIDLVFLLLFTITALMLNYEVLIVYFQENIPKKLLYLAAIGLLFIGVVVVAYMKFSKSNLNQKIKKFITGLKDGILSILKMQKKEAFILHSLFIWALYVASFYAASLALEQTSTISLSTLIITFVVGSFTFAFTNSGFGSYPFAIASILLLFGIPETAGTAFGWIIWTSNIIAIVLFGGLSFLFLPIYNKEQ